MAEEEKIESKDDASIGIEGDISSHIVVGDNNVINFTRVVSHIELSPEEIQIAYKKLHEKIEYYFDIVAETLYDNNYLQEKSLKGLQNAKEILRENVSDPELALSRAQFEVRRVHVEIAKEQQFQRGENRLRWVVPTLVIVYVAAIVSIIVFGGSVWTTTSEIPVLGVPLSILVWAAIGSVAAILFRFYTRQRVRITDEIRWLIARPIIGLIMGALSYLVVISGLIVFSVSTGTDIEGGTARPQLLWGIAFLGGFSDKFFESIINIVVGRLSGPLTESK
jgi:hypothetical protein